MPWPAHSPWKSVRLRPPACATFRTTLPGNRTAPEHGDGFRYVDADGRAVRDEDDARAHPLAWPSRRPGPTSGSARARRPPPGHRARRARTQAVPLPPALARGARRDQVRPHARVRPRRCRASARASTRDLALPGLPREKVLATVVRLLETTLIRVGNEEYARDERLVRPDHAARPARAASTARRSRFKFRGKSGVEHDDRAQRPRAWRAIVAALPRPAGPGAVPVRRRGRRARTPSTRPTSTTTCARSPAQDFTGQGLPHLGRHACSRRARSAGRSSASTRARRRKRNVVRGDRVGRQAARQHAGGVPQVLRAPGGDRCLSRRAAAGCAARRRGGHRPASQEARRITRAAVEALYWTSRRPGRRASAPYRGAAGSRARPSSPPP